MLSGKYKLGKAFPEGTRLASVPPERAASFANEHNHRLVAALDGVATERGHRLLELAFAWLAARPAIGSVIAGASSPEQVAANVAALDWKLTEDDLAAVDAAVGAV